MNYYQIHLPIHLSSVEILICKGLFWSKTSQPGSNVQYHLSIRSSPEIRIPNELYSLKDEQEYLLFKSFELSFPMTPLLL